MAMERSRLYVDHPAGPLPGQLVAADFNRDGQLDLALISNDDTTISVFLGKGDGTFEPKVDYPAGVSVVGLTVGDYDGDGILDLAVTDSLCTGSPCPASGSVNVLLGNGDGTFKRHVDFANGGQPISITTGEFKYAGQQGVPVGRPGFAAANQQNNTVSVFLAVPTGLVSSIPTVAEISPSSAPVNSGAFTITVDGTNFNSGSTVYFAGQARATIVSSATQLSAFILATDLATEGLTNLAVFNPPPGGGFSTSIALNVYGPPPAISSLSPSIVVAGGPAFTLIVNGLNFLNGTTVNFNGAQRLTTFLSNTQLAISISAHDIARQGMIDISVTDPVGNGGNGVTSSSSTITILPVNVQPVVGLLTPASATAGGPSFTLTIAGTGFTVNSTVTFNSTIVSSHFIGTTQLQADIPASSIAVAGAFLVTVLNMGGIPSVVVTFTVNNPVPDFAVSVVTMSPPISAGQAASYILMVTPSNKTTSNPVTLAVMSMLPAGATATFSPSTIPAGSGATTVTLSIATTSAAAVSAAKKLLIQSPPLYLLALAIGSMGLGLLIFSIPVRRLAPQFLLVSLLVMAAGLAACGAVSSTSSPQSNIVTPGTPAGTYRIVVTATSRSGSLSTTVPLTVK